MPIMYDSSLSALSEAWESVAATKKELTNVRTKIRQSGERSLHDLLEDDDSVFQERSDGHYVDSNAALDYKGMYRKENIPPCSYPQPHLPADYTGKARLDSSFSLDEFIAARKEGVRKRSNDYCASGNLSRENRTPNSSRRNLLRKNLNSTALSRLKQKINQQKLTASLSSNNSFEDAFPEPPKHGEADPVQVAEEDVAMKEPMKRKVAHAPSAPSYKGFSQADGYQSKVGPAAPQRKYYGHPPANKGKNSKSAKTMEQSKMSRKVKSKVQRKVSPNKAVPSINTYSWRVGQEIRERLLRERKGEKKAVVSIQDTVSDPRLTQAEKPYESNSDAKTTSKSVSEKNVKSRDLDENTEIDMSMPKDKCGEESNSIEVMDDKNLKGGVGGSKLSESASVSTGSRKTSQSQEFKISVSTDKTQVTVKDCKALSKNARSILSDMSDMPKDKPATGKKKITSVIDTGLSKTKIAKLSPGVKRKSEAELQPKRKIRHYDQEEIQKYMQKQQAERRKQRLKEKKQQQEMKETQQKKLQDLFEKQKSALKENLENVKQSTYGETFVKLSSKISSLSTDPSYISSRDEYADESASLDVPTYPIPQERSSPQRKDNIEEEEMYKDSLDLTGMTKGDQSGLSSYRHLSHNSASVKSDAYCLEKSLGVEEMTDVQSIDVQSKANRVAAIQSTAAALRKRLDIEAKRIASLVQNRQVSQRKASSTIAMIVENDDISGEVPGTHNIEEQASLNVKLQKMEEAAKRIQAFYRGHSTRKSLQWKLPSGRTLYQAFEGARRSAFLSDTKAETPVKLASSNYPAITMSGMDKRFDSPLELAEPATISISNMNEPVEGSIKLAEPVQLDSNPLSEMHDIRLPASDTVDNDLSQKSERGSTESLISEALTVSRMMHQSYDERSNVFESQSSLDMQATINDSFPSYSAEKSFQKQKQLLQDYDEKVDSLRQLLKKHKEVPGDKYSVINIFTRNYPNLRRQQLLEEMKGDSDLDTEQLLAEAYEEEQKSLGGEAEDDYSTERSANHLTDESLSEQSLRKASSVDISRSEKVVMNRDNDDEDRSTSDITNSELVLADLPSLRSMTVHRSYEAALERSGKSIGSAGEKPPNTSSDADSEMSSLNLTSQHSTEFSEIDTRNLKPVFSSTQRSLDPKEAESGTSTLLADEGDNIEFSAKEKSKPPLYAMKHLNDARMSPNTLERKLRAEINLFASVGTSLQQVGELEKVRNVVDAQQETVSIAQVLKSRQVAHAQEVEKLALEAKHRAMMSAQEVDTVKQAAREASLDMMKSIAEVKSKAVEEIAASAVQLAQIQQKTTSTTMEALNQVEQARQAAASAYKQSVDHQLPAVGELAASIAFNVARYHRHQEGDKDTLYASSVAPFSSEVRSRSPITLSPSSPYADDFEGEKSSSSQTATGIPSQSEIMSGHDVETNTDFRPMQAFNSSNSKLLITSKTQSCIEESLSVNKTAVDESDKISPKFPSKSVSDKSDEKISESMQSELSSKSGTIVEDLEVGHLETTIQSSGSGRHTVKEIDVSELLVEQETFFGSETNMNDSARNSEEKFNSSFTEEEIKHDFRMVLPSENHRRKSIDHIDNLLTGNDTSSDEVASPRISGKWAKRLRVKSPFADENTFTKFTANMVRQYIQEDEVRAKHQAALLELREKAIMEKSKVEMAYLEMQKKALKRKGTDEKMPPITKKQRAVLMRLQAEQSEIKRLKEAHKAAMYERRSMLFQQKQIEKIRETTQKIWNKLQLLNKTDGSPKSLLDDTVKSEPSPSSFKSISAMDDSFKSELSPTNLKFISDDSIAEEKSLTPSANQTSYVSEATHITESISKGAGDSVKSPASVPSGLSGKRVSNGSSHTSGKRTVSESSAASENVVISVEESIRTEKSNSKRASRSVTPTKSGASQRRKSTASNNSRSSQSDSVDSKTDNASILQDSRDEVSSIAQDLTKLKYISGKKYLTEREMKLEARKEQFKEILLKETLLKDWRQKIIEEEMKLKEDIRRVLERGKSRDLAKILGSETANDNSKTIENYSKTDSLHEVEAFSINEDFSLGKDSKSLAIPESIDEALTKTSPSQLLSQKSVLSTEISRYSKNDVGNLPLSRSLTYKYSVETFENGSEVLSGKKSLPDSYKDVKRSSKVSYNSVSASHHAKKSEEDSFTEGTSDASDIEQRLKGLESELGSRKFELERLRRRKEKALLRLKEEALRKELQAVELQILQENKENIPYNAAASTASRKSTPLVLSPSTPTIKSEKAKVLQGKESYRDLSVKDCFTDAASQSGIDFDEESSKHRSDKSVQVTRNNILENEVSKIVTSIPRDIRLKSEGKSVSVHTASDLQVGNSGDSTSISENIVSSTRGSQSIVSRRSKKSKQMDNAEDIYGEDFDIESEIRSYSITEDVSHSRTSTLVDTMDPSELSAMSNKSERKSYSTSPPKTNINIENDKDNVESATHTDILSVDSRLVEFSKTSQANYDQSKVAIENRSFVISEELTQTSKASRALSKGEPKKTSSGISEVMIKNQSSLISEQFSQISKTGSTQSISEFKKPSSVISGSEVKNQHSVISEQLSQTSKAGSEKELRKHSSAISEELSRMPKSIESISEIKERYSVKSENETENQSSAMSEELSLMSEADSTQSKGEFTGQSSAKSKSEIKSQPSLVSEKYSLISKIDIALPNNELTKQSSGISESEIKSKSLISEEFSQMSKTGSTHSAVDLKNQFSVISEKANIISKSPDISEKSAGFNSDSSKKSLISDIYFQTSLQKQSIHDEDPSVGDSINLLSKDESISFSLLEKESGEDGDLKSSSYSFEVEIPSPKKLDLGPMADSITESILKTLLIESLHVPSRHLENQVLEVTDMAQKSEYRGRTQSPLSDENSHSVIKSTSIEPQVDSATSEKPTMKSDINAVATHLIDDALTHMINVKNLKQVKIKQIRPGESYTGEVTHRNNLLSLIVDDDRESELTSTRLVEREGGANDVSPKLDELKSIQDHLSALCGDEEEEDEVELSTTFEERVILPPKSFRHEEPVFLIPWTVDDTQNLVFKALDELQFDSLTRNDLSTFEPSDDYLSHKSGGENLDETYTKMYKMLVFDTIKGVLTELKDFHEFQKQTRPPWMKVQRKIFSKFTRNSHTLDPSALREEIANYVTTCLDLQEGRPSLEKLKRRLPLNVNKKDYVDAVLVEEIRAEEPLWVNYDEDEMKVKFQLADDILDVLIKEAIELINIF